MEKGLNDPFVGGLSSYGLVIMIAMILQEHFPNGMPSDHTGVLGAVFVLFLRKYADPSFVERGVWIHPGRLSPQEIKARDAINAGEVSNMIRTTTAPLYVLDPLDIKNNVGRSCFGALQLINAFAEALEAIQVTNFSYSAGQNEISILGSCFSTGHHRHVVQLVTKVWCPDEVPKKNKTDIREWAVTAKAVLDAIEESNFNCPICKCEPNAKHVSGCKVEKLLSAYKDLPL